LLITYTLNIDDFMQILTKLGQNPGNHVKKITRKSTVRNV
jgi:hypothetical protein